MRLDSIKKCLHRRTTLSRLNTSPWTLVKNWKWHNCTIPILVVSIFTWRMWRLRTPLINRKHSFNARRRERHSSSESKLSPLESTIDTKKEEEEEVKNPSRFIRMGFSFIFGKTWRTFTNKRQQRRNRRIWYMFRVNVYVARNSKIFTHSSRLKFGFECIGICIIFTCANLPMEMMNMRAIGSPHGRVNQLDERESNRD